MVDRNVSKTLVSISLWGSLLNFQTKKKRKENSLSDCFLLTLNFLWGFVFYLLFMFCSVGVLLYVCIMNLRPVYARHLKFGFVILRELNLV